VTDKQRQRIRTKINVNLTRGKTASNIPAIPSRADILASATAPRRRRRRR
jgi:hypothetical protein